MVKNTEDEGVVIQTTSFKRIQVSKWIAQNKKEYLSFREWYLPTENSEIYLPGRNGITIPWELGEKFLNDSLELFKEPSNKLSKEKIIPKLKKVIVHSRPKEKQIRGLKVSEEVQSELVSS